MLFKPFGEHLAKINLAFWSFYVINSRFMQKSLCFGNIPYYISRHNFERTDFVKWLEECSVWINNKEKASFDDIFQYWETLVLQHQNTKYKSENDRLKMKHQLLCVLQDSIAFKDELNELIKYILSELRIKDLLIDSDIVPDEWENLKSLLELEMWSSIRSHTKR
jgi:DNA helicase-2/ATP-dependent DNA helicase PcrA